MERYNVYKNGVYVGSTLADSSKSAIRKARNASVYMEDNGSDDWFATKSTLEDYDEHKKA